MVLIYIPSVKLFCLFLFIISKDPSKKFYLVNLLPPPSFASFFGISLVLDFCSPPLPKFFYPSPSLAVTLGPLAISSRSARPPSLLKFLLQHLNCFILFSEVLIHQDG